MSSLKFFLLFAFMICASSTQTITEIEQPYMYTGKIDYRSVEIDTENVPNSGYFLVDSRTSREAVNIDVPSNVTGFKFNLMASYYLFQFEFCDVQALVTESTKNGNMIMKVDYQTYSFNPKFNGDSEVYTLLDGVNHLKVEFYHRDLSGEDIPCEIWYHFDFITTD